MHVNARETVCTVCMNLAHLCVMLLVLLQHLDDQLGQAECVLQLFGRCN